MIDDEDAERPECPGCGRVMTCQGCDDNRPEAGDVHGGWRLLSPLGRWEDVERTEHPKYGPVRIFTTQAGPEMPWLYWATTKVDARWPDIRLHGAPEVRIFESDWADGPMYAVATQDTDHRGALQLAFAGPATLAYAQTQGRGHGWEVTHHPGGGPAVTTHHDSKAQARSALRALGREYAKKLGVRFTLPGKSGA